MEAALNLNFRQRIGWLAHAFKASTQNHHRELMPLLSTLTPADGVVFDVGAHAGHFSRLFASIAHRGQVHAFEPSPYARSVLRKALDWNRVRNVSVSPFGLGAADATLTLRTPLKKGGLGFGLAHVGDAAGRPCREDAIEIRTIDGVVQDLGLKRLDFVKADVEGWEGRMIEGGLETLKRFKPALLLEIDAHCLGRSGMTRAGVWALLQPLGYTAGIVGDDGAVTPVEALEVDADYLFTARERPQP